MKIFSKIARWMVRTFHMRNPTLQKDLSILSFGKTVSECFQKISSDYLKTQNRKKELYEEMVIAFREMERGIPEGKVYENFGKRCQVNELKKFGMLLSRNLKKGSIGLSEIVREEARKAYTARQEEIRKLGETAGTKLLFPMILLLLVVLIMIMVPAFTGFSL